MGQNLQEKFFFAEGDAEFYDDTIELTVPYYQLVHDTMIDILKYHFGADPVTIEGIILDVGAGTGTESLSVMKNFPKLHTLAIDVCAPMKGIFDNNYTLKFGSDAKKRYKYLVEDIMSVSEADPRVKSYFNAEKQEGCAAAISAYCIHHFKLAEKGDIYQKMFDFLKPGGLLINMDLFNYESKEVSAQAHNFDIAYIKREFDNPSPQFVNSSNIPAQKREALKEKWVNHMNRDNILDSVDAQIKQLRDIGFVNVECVFKYWQQGVLRAKKPV